MCTTALTKVPSLNKKLTTNKSKNVNLLMTHTMHENVRPFFLRDNVCETYLSIQQFRPKNDEQRVIVLAKTDEIGSARHQAICARCTRHSGQPYPHRSG